jgi:hypothetical protein
LSQARDSHTAISLTDGRVLIAGGWGGSVATASAELYDPKTGRFSPTGSLPEARYGQIAALLSDGRVLIAGGARDAGTALNSADLYDPNGGTFKTTESMANTRYGSTATLLLDGRVLIAGGQGLTAATSAELCQP